MYSDFKKSGVIHKIIQTKIKQNYSNFIYALDIVKFIEKLILQYTKFNQSNPTKSGIAFPVGISINDIAAHFTPDENNNPKINKDDIIKIDYGVHINGCISDGAFSWCPSGKYDELIKISEGATNIGIINSGPDVILGEIGELIQEYIESKEIEIDNKLIGIKSIYDLCGHKIAPYKIHAGKAVPNVGIPYYQRMIEDEIYAIETFPTTGNGSIYEDKVCNHFMIENYISNNCEKTKKLFDIRSTLPFCPRWFDFDIPDNEIIKKFPVLKTTDNGLVAQYEKTIYIKNNGYEVLN